MKDIVEYSEATVVVKVIAVVVLLLAVVVVVFVVVVDVVAESVFAPDKLLPSFDVPVVLSTVVVS